MNQREFDYMTQREFDYINQREFDYMTFKTKINLAYENKN
jgi:hypothetical protein